MILTIDKSLEKLNIPAAKHNMATSTAQLEKYAKSYGFPVVLKLVSPEVIHKTEANGVQIAHNMDDLKKISATFLKRGKVLIQEHCTGVEMFLGIKNDPTFGHVLLTGIGGIFVEVFKDVAFRVCPITVKDAEQMLDELKGKALLKGVRGQKPVNQKELVDAMVSISKLPKKIPKLEELDVNPFFINDKEGKAADARIVLKE